MRGVFFAFLLAICPGQAMAGVPDPSAGVPDPSAADDSGQPVLFAGRPAPFKMPVPATAKAGDVLWQSGPSDPMPSGFEAVIFQGLLADPGVSFEVSLRGLEGWSAWIPAQVERSRNGRFWGRFSVSGEKGSTLRFRLVHRGVKIHQPVEIFQMELAPTEKEAPVSPAPLFEVPAATDTEKPLVRPREAWKAAPASKPYEPMIPVRITIHHTEASQPMTEEDAIQELQIIQAFHQKGRGWIDIGYHFLIDGSGRLWQGRPETVVGAHVRNKNEGNVGISLMGSFHPPKNMQPTPEQLRQVVLLARWLVAAYRIDPQSLRGHRDQQPTSCPGDILYARLDEIRRDVAAPVPQVLLVRPPGEGIPSPIRALNSPALERLREDFRDPAPALRMIFEGATTR